jgi:hypothetical protein
MPHALLISYLTWSFYSYLTKSTSYKPPHYIIFSDLLFFHPPSVQIFCLTPCSPVPSVCVLPFMSETKIYNTTGCKNLRRLDIARK